MARARERFLYRKGSKMERSVSTKHLNDASNEHMPHMVESLQGLCRCPSVANNKDGMRRAVSHLRALCREAGASSVRVVPTGGEPAIVALFGRGEPLLVMYEHYDVQPIGDERAERWRHPPFGAAIEKGRLFARGVADTKGNIIARLAALYLYRKLYGPLPFRVMLVIEGEEEVGSPHLQQIVEQEAGLLRQANAALWESASRTAAFRPQIYCGMKGALVADFFVRTMPRHEHSGRANGLRNAAERLIAAFHSIKGPDGVVHLPSYSKVPPLSAAAMEYISQLAPSELSHRQRLLREFGDTGADRDGGALARAIYCTPTANVCGIQGGSVEAELRTICLGDCRLRMDFRLMPGMSPATIEQELRNRLDACGFRDVVLETLVALEPYHADVAHPWAQSVIETARKVYTQPPAVLPLYPASGPMAVLLAPFSIPVASIGVGNHGSHIHGGDENIRLADLKLCTRHLVRVLEAFPATL